jgi:hypothetical protein
MIFSPDLIKSILLEDHLSEDDIEQLGEFLCGFDELVDGIVGELQAIADIDRRLRIINDKEQTLMEEHNKAIDDIRTSRCDVMSECRHHSTTHFPDASGGNASTTTCNTCGKEV